MFALFGLVCFLVAFVLNLSLGLFEWTDLGFVFLALALTLGNWPAVPWHRP